MSAEIELRKFPPEHQALRRTTSMDVVFVHGLGGDLIKTWQRSPQQSWPQWVADDHPHVQVWSLGYPAAIGHLLRVSESAQLGTRPLAIAIADRLRSASPSIGTRPCIFVCHSLGGLLIKRLLVEARAQAGTDIDAFRHANVASVMFLGTPHRGSAVATALNMLDDIKKVSAKLLAPLLGLVLPGNASPVLTTSQLIDELPQDGTVEFLQSYAFPLPVMVIAHILGVPQSDINLFRTWSSQLTRALDAGNDADILLGADVSIELRDYFRDMLRGRHSLPEHSVMRRLTTGDAAGLSEYELLYGCAFLLWAGHETTKNLIASGILILAERPADLAALQQHPELIEGAIEEILRFESPLQKISRWAHADFTFGDVGVPQGTFLTALIGAANRDPAVFTLPDRFDLRRTKNRHIGFGHGIHHCLGAALSRSEARIALGALVPNLRHLELVQHQWRTHSAFRSLESLHVRVKRTPT